MFSRLVLTNRWYQQLYHQLKEAMDLDKVSWGLVSLPQKESMVQIGGALLTSGDWYSIFIYSNTGEHEGGKKNTNRFSEMEQGRAGEAYLCHIPDGKERHLFQVTSEDAYLPFFQTYVLSGIMSRAGVCITTVMWISRCSLDVKNSSLTVISYRKWLSFY